MEEAVAAGDGGLLGQLLGTTPRQQEELDELLHTALEHGKADCAELLVKAGAGVHSSKGRGKRQVSTLMTVITSGVARNGECLQWVLSQGVSKEAINEAFISAAKFGRDDYLGTLLQHGADVNTVEPAYCNTALLLACLRSCPSAVRMLLEHNADANIRNKQGDTALHKAVANPKDDGECVRILVEHGADLNATNNVKETPLTRGIERQSLESVSALIAHLAKTEEGRSIIIQALHLAASKDSHLILDKMLSVLERPLAVNTADFDGNTPLHLAGILSSGHNRSNKVEHAKILLEKGADINSKNKHGNTPLQSNVAHNASIEFLAYLIDKGADINNTNHQGTTPLEEAVKGFSLPAVSVLLKHGARTFPTTTEASDSGKIGLLPLLVHRDGDGNTIIHKAASSMEFAHCLAGLFSLRDESSVEEGEKLFLSSNSKGDTPLHCALRNGVWDAIDAILVASAREDILSYRNHEGESPVDIAITESNVWCLPLFTKTKGHDWLTTEVKERICRHRDGDGNTLLHVAAAENSIDAVEFCLSAGIDINSSCLDEMTSAFATGGTPLHLAAEKGHEEVLRFLLEKGADVNSVAEYNKNTPGHLAARNGHEECLRVLVQIGKADLTILNSEEESIQDCAEEEGISLFS